MLGPSDECFRSVRVVIIRILACVDCLQSQEKMRAPVVRVLTHGAFLRDEVREKQRITHHFQTPFPAHPRLVLLTHRPQAQPDTYSRIWQSIWLQLEHPLKRSEG